MHKMAIKLGSTDINSIYLGSTEVVKVYLGATEVYSAAAPAALELDPPASSDFTTHYAWGLDRMLEGYTGDTVRLERLSDNVEADFGFDSAGQFDIDAVHTWRSGADVDVVLLYDQGGSAYDMTPVNQVTLIVSDVVQYFAYDISDTDGQLTRKTDAGGVGMDFGLDTGYMKTANLVLDGSAGLEFHMLFSPQRRKAAGTGDPLGGSNATEHYLTYGLSDNTHIRYYGGGSAANSIKIKTNSGVTDLKGNSDVLKQYSQHVMTFRYDTTNISMYSRGELTMFDPMAASNVTNITSGGFMDDGAIGVGNAFSGSSGAFRTNQFGNMLFGGLIVTELLTDKQRTLLHAKLNAVGQQHRLQSTDTILGYFDEVWLPKNVNPITGTLVGEKGAATLQFNIVDGTPSWDFEYIQPDIGFQGIYADDDENTDNGFKATSTFFSGTTSGTMMGIHMMDATGNSGAYTSLLQTNFVQATGDGYDDSILLPDRSLAIGVDHSCPTFETRFASSRDDDDLFYRRTYIDESNFGNTSGPYEFGDNQAVGRYNTKLAHQEMVYVETIDGYTWTQDTWEGVDGSYPGTLLDAPVHEPVPENITFEHKLGTMLVHIGTFEEPVGYDRGDDYATRKAVRLDATTHGWVTGGFIPFGSLDGSYARKIGESGVADSADNAYIMSQQYQLTMKGTRFFMGVSSTVFDITKVEETLTNAWKFLE
jgi:hypothetical protein